LGRKGRSPSPLQVGDRKQRAKGRFVSAQTSAFRIERLCSSTATSDQMTFFPSAARRKEQIGADKLEPVDRCCVRGQSPKARLQDANSLLQRLLCTMLFVRLFDGSRGQQVPCDEFRRSHRCNILMYSKLKNNYANLV